MIEIPKPPLADSNAEIIDVRVREAGQTPGTRQSVTIELRGNQVSLEVIDMDLNLLYYNPDTHRIRAQRTMDPVRDRRLNESPWSPESQDYLEDLLRCAPASPDKRDPEFDALRQSLLEFGQAEPGIITRQGVVVNGNTRRAALRELGRTHIRVGVLPPSVGWSDVSAVELSLQLRKEHRRAYSFINHLLALEEQANNGRTPEAIARDFRIHLRTYHRDRWILNTIHELIKRSSEGGNVLRLVDFEDNKEKLVELYRDVERLKADPDAAQLLRELRLLAISLGFSKTDVRNIDEDFLDKYLIGKLPAEMIPIVSGPATVEVPGLGGIEVPAASTAVQKAVALTDTALKAKAKAGAMDSTAAAAAKTFDTVRDSVDRAIEQAGRSNRLKKRQLAAPDRLSDACDDVDACVADLAASKATQSLDEDAFEDAVRRLRISLTKLARQASRAIPEPGEGVEWLLKVASE